MKKNLKFYLQLFTSTFYLSAFTVGGGYVIIPLMKKKFVDEYRWIEEQEIMDLMAIAQSSPGAIAVNAAILIGYRLAGILGALVTIAATVLPPFITLSIISVAYTAFRDSLIVNYILKGMQAAVVAVIIDVVINMIKDLKKEGKMLPYIIMICAFIAAFVLNINIIFIIIASGIAGLLSMLYLKHKKRSTDVK